MKPLEPTQRWALLVAAIFGLVLAHAWFSQFNHDEIEHLHVAWLIAQGQKPYADFLEQHHPVLGYLLAPAVGWFGSVRGLVFAARLFDLGCILACLFSFSRMLRRVYPDVPVRWPLLLLVTSFMFLRSSMEVRPDPLMNALVYAGLLNLIAFLQERTPWRALLAGAFLGAAAAVLQKALVVLALVGGALMLLALLHRRDPARRNRILLGGAALLGTALLPLAALFAFVRSQGYLQDFWFWNYEFNRYFYTQAVLSKHFSVLASIGLSVLVNPVLWAAGCSGIVLCARELWRGRKTAAGADDARIALLVVALGYLLFLCFNRFPLDQYFIVVLPLLALFSAEVFARAEAAGGRPRAFLQRSVLFMVVVLACILLLYPGNRPQREVQDHVLARTALGQAIFVPPPFHPIFRPDSSYFFYNGKLVGDAYVDYCRLHPACPGRKQDLDEKRWASDPPAFVYLDEPEYYPLRWLERAHGYEETSIPRLLRAPKGPPGGVPGRPPRGG
jgi:hypothetical protein